MLKVNNLIGFGAGGSKGHLINGSQVNLLGLGALTVDPNSRLTLTESRVTFTSMPRNEDCFLSIPFINPVQPDEDCELLMDVRGSYIENGGGAYFGISNLADDYLDIVGAGKNFAGSRILGNSTGPYITTAYVEADGGSEYLGSSVQIGNNTTRYYKIQINRSVGTYGTLYVKVASSDANRTANSFLFTQSVALKSKAAYTNLIAVSSRNDGFSLRLSGFIENIKISKALS